MKRAAYILLTLLLLTSCATKKHIEYVDREVVRYEVQVRHDTTVINTHDSIYHTIIQRGDTVYNTKYVERIKYLDKYVYLHDTVYRNIMQTQTVKTTVEKKVVPKWAYYSLAICVLFLIYATIRLLKWLKVI